jgi:hypothetical protein
MHLPSSMFTLQACTQKHYILRKCRNNCYFARVQVLASDPGLSYTTTATKNIRLPFMILLCRDIYIYNFFSERSPKSLQPTAIYSSYRVRINCSSCKFSLPHQSQVQSRFQFMVQNTLQRSVSEPIRKEPFVMQENFTRHESRTFITDF